MSPQGCSIFSKLVMSIHQTILTTFNLHRHKPGTLSVQNHLGKEPEASPNLRLLLKVGVGGDLEGEEKEQ